MKKIIDLAYAGISLFLLFTFGYVVAHAQQGQSFGAFPIFIPIAYHQPAPKYSISGRVVNAQNVGISGVTIRTAQGQSTLTDQNGAYALSGLPGGTYSITPSLGSLVFSPTTSVVVVPPDASGVNFSAPAQCSQPIINSGFETNTGWEIPLTAYPAGYSTGQVHTGSRSMRTGILKLADNVYSYSDFRQAVQIPSYTTAATAHFWLYTLSGEAMSLAQPETVQPTGKPFDQSVLSGDVQYVLVLDHNKNWIGTLVWERSDEGYWHYYELDLRKYAGTTIYLQFGTYNDGLNGITSMFVDDVSVDTCTGTPAPTPSPTPTRTPTPTATPTPGPCQELVTNNYFSLNTGWIILDTEYHAGYSNAEYHSASRSMRTGIVNLADNIYSYSDFRQVVSIPSSAHHVTLSTWEYFISNGTTGLSQPEQIIPTGRPFNETLLSDDLQYLLILDQNKNWIGTLVWQRSNSKVWTNMQFDLSAYAGQTIMLQWGTFNNGTGGVTAMYVDDVSLQACP